MIDLLVNVFNILGSILNFVVNASYYTGKFLVAAGAWSYNCLHLIVSNVANLSSVLYEDFSYFYSDIWAFLSSAWSTINSGIKNTIDGVVHTTGKTSSSISNIFTEGGFKVNKLVNNGFDFIGLLLLKLKEFLILLGNGSWFLITLLPKLAYSITVVVWKISIAIWEKLGQGYRLTTKRILDGTKVACNYFMDVPLHCALGLVALYLTYKYKFILSNSIYRFSLIVYNKFRSYGRIFRMRRRRVRRSQPIREDDLDATIMSPPLFASSLTTVGSMTRKPLRRSTAKELNGSPNTNLLCVVCLDRKKTAVVLPCRHLCLCTPCSHQLQNFQNSCPLCREEIDEIIDTYI